MRDRVVGFKRVQASLLRANEKNWRLHPQGQRDALSAMFRRIGFVGALIARELPDGELELLDGHLRQDLAADAEVPVVIVDLDDEEMAEVLLTYDPISGMAIPDESKLRELVKMVDLDGDAELRKLLTDVERMLADEEASKTESENEHELEGMNLQPHEHYDYLVVLATTTHEWNVLCAKLGLEPEKRRKRMGTCRAIRAGQLLRHMTEVPGA